MSPPPFGPSVDPSCIDFRKAEDSLFVDTNSNTINFALNVVPQLMTALTKLGIDFVANFWQYWRGELTAPQEFQDIQRTVLASATSFFQPDLLKHELFYSAEIGAGHNIVVVAHSEGNLYANQAYDVVTSIDGKHLFHIVAVATPASRVADSGP